MVKAIIERSASIFVADPSETVRIEIMGALRAVGFKNITPCASLAEVRRGLQHSQADWIVTSLFGADADNAFALLKLLLTDARYKDTRTTVLVDPNEMACLPLAFEQGLLSWQKKPFTKQTLQAEFEDLNRSCQRSEMDPTLIAAEYLRRYLAPLKQGKPLVALEEGLVSLYYGRPELLLNLAEAQLLAGRPTDAHGTLIRAKLFDRTLEARAVRILKAYGVERLGLDLSKAEAMDLGLKICVVVDRDEAMQRSVKEILGSLKVPKVEAFADGEAAWKWLSSHPEPDLVIQEWKIPGALSGPALLQRIRAHKFVEVPVIILSSLLTPRDAPLLSEMSVANVIAKPFSRNEFILAVRWTILQEKYPTDVKAMERKILKLLEMGKQKDALPLKKAYLANPSVSDGGRRYIEAEFLYHERRFKEAQAKAVEAVKLMGKSALGPLNLLGKCLLQLRDFNAAIQVLEQARKVSPENIERLLDVAEMRLLRNEGKAAMSLVDEAKNLDATNERVQKVEVRAAIAANQSKRACELMATMESLSEVVAYMNNRAVALSRVKRYPEAVELYQSTLASIPEGKRETKLVVAYNLGLCHARNNNLPGALATLEPLCAEAHPIHVKAVSLVKRVKDAVSTGKGLALIGDPAAGSGSEALEDDLDDLYESFGTEFVVDAGKAAAAKAGSGGVPGSACLAYVFKNPEPPDNFSAGLLRAAKISS